MDDNAKAIVQFAENDFFIGITPSGHAQVMETNSTRNSAASPMELLMIALGGCTGVDVHAVLQKKRQEVTGYHLEITGERRAEFPRSFTSLHVKHVVRGRNVSPQAVARAIELSETKYCSVAATLRGAATISSSFEVVEEPAAATAAQHEA